MRQEKFYMKAWLDAHSRIRTVDTDAWYLDFANHLLAFVNASSLYKEERMADKQALALSATLYLEDCVADGGNWRQFIRWHRQNYDRYLPFYPLSEEEYLPDEINREDVAFLVWAVRSPSGGGFLEDLESPMDADLLAFADSLYDYLDAAFESAPISEHLAVDWLMETSLMDKKRTPLPVPVPGEQLPVHTEHFLEASGGEPLMYFDSYDALSLFCIQDLGWEDDDLDHMSDLMECDDFVLYANPKGLLIAPDVAAYFADVRNPLYSAEAAEEEAWELFCEKGICPFDLLKYAMEHRLLPEAQFPFEDGKRLLHENWDFIARWFLDEYYEGE